MKYFAYGSNMCSNRLRSPSRVPSSEFVAVGSIKGYTLKFHKHSTDGSGKCNAFHTGDESNEVMGVIFELSEGEKPALDSAEGLGHGYHELEITVNTMDGVITASMYVADSSAIDDSLMPYTWYKDFVVEGAKQHSLLASYIQNIEAIQAQIDPDKRREEDNRRLLPC